MIFSQTQSVWLLLSLLFQRRSSESRKKYQIIPIRLWLKCLFAVVLFFALDLFIIDQQCTAISYENLAQNIIIQHNKCDVGLSIIVRYSCYNRSLFPSPPLALSLSLYRSLCTIVGFWFAFVSLYCLPSQLRGPFISNTHARIKQKTSDNPFFPTISFHCENKRINGHSREKKTLSRKNCHHFLSAMTEYHRAFVLFPNARELVMMILHILLYRAIKHSFAVWANWVSLGESWLCSEVEWTAGKAPVPINLSRFLWMFLVVFITILVAASMDWHFFCCC